MAHPLPTLPLLTTIPGVLWTRTRVVWEVCKVEEKHPIPRGFRGVFVRGGVGIVIMVVAVSGLIAGVFYVPTFNALTLPTTPTLRDPGTAQGGGIVSWGYAL